MSRILLVTWCLVFGLCSTCLGAITNQANKLELEAPQGYFVFRSPVSKSDTRAEKAAVAHVNAVLRQLAINQGNDMQATWQQTAAEDKENYKSKDVDYTVTYLSNNLASIIFTTTFAQGEREALLFKEGWTFDLTSGEPVGWQKLVKNEDVAKLSKDYILKQLRQAAVQDNYVIYLDTTKMDATPKNYYIGSNGYVHLLFNPYKVGPASSGVIDLDTDCQIINS